MTVDKTSHPLWATHTVTHSVSGLVLYARYLNGEYFCNAYADSHVFDMSVCGMYGDIKVIDHGNYKTPLIYGIPMPYWATHIVRDRRAPHHVWYARHDSHHRDKDWFTGPTDTWQFHPASADIVAEISDSDKKSGIFGEYEARISGNPSHTESVPCTPKAGKMKTVDATESPKEVVFEKGQVWLVRLNTSGRTLSDKALCKMTVDAVFDHCVHMSYFNNGSVTNYYEKSQITQMLVEQI